MFTRQNAKLQAVVSTACLTLLLLSLAGFTPTPPPPSSDITAHITQVDTDRFPVVTAYVSVINAAGEPVAVSPSQISLQENGSPMKIDEISAAGDIGPLVTMLVIDTSGSMNHGGKLEAAKAAAQAYVDQARQDDLIGILSFNTAIELVQPLTRDKPALLEAIDGLKAQHDTAMYDALDQALEILAPFEGRKAIIVMTDGLDNRSKLNPLELANRVGSAGLTISTIGLGDPTHSQGAITSLDEAGLRALAREAGGEYGYANDAGSLTELYARYGRALQSEYAITYTSPSNLRDGVNRALSVSLASGPTGAASPVRYNPGGLVPEVAEPASWLVFGGLLAGLLVLLAAPFIFQWIFSRRDTGGKKGGRVKLASAPPAPRKAKSTASKLKLKS